MIKKYVMSSIGYEKKNKSFENRANFAILTTISLLTITPPLYPLCHKTNLNFIRPQRNRISKIFVILRFLISGRFDEYFSCLSNT